MGLALAYSSGSALFNVEWDETSSGKFVECVEALRIGVVQILLQLGKSTPLTVFQWTGARFDEIRYFLAACCLAR